MNESTFWEQVATSRWGAYISDIEREAIVEGQKLSNLPGHAIEIGCEGGRWSRLLTDHGWTLTCIDIDERTLRVCHARLLSARCILTSPEAQSIPCSTQSAQLILCMEVQNVIETAWFIEEVDRLLKSDGVLVGTFFNRHSLRGWLGHVTSRHRKGFDYYKTSYPVWRSRLQQCGFTFVKETGLCWFPFRRGSNSALVPLATKTERIFRLRKLVEHSPWVVFVARRNA